MASLAPRALRGTLLCVGLLAATVAVGCGDGARSSAPAVTGPGIAVSEPPWRPDYAHLRERMVRFGVPSPGTEKYHHHAQLHVYYDGLLVPIPPKIGVAPGRAAALHTHDPGGVIHIESSRRFAATLGDFFAIWGVAFGSKQLGSLRPAGDEQIHVLVNGKPRVDPINYVIREGDNIVVAYGRPGSFPKSPPVTLLRREQSGGGGATCGEQKGRKTRKKSCTAG